MQRQITKFFDQAPKPARPVAQSSSPPRALSLFDPFKLSLKPWTETGGVAEYVGDELKLDDEQSINAFLTKYRDVRLVLAFPPMPSLAQAGARWWKAKEVEDPDFQKREARGVRLLYDVLSALGSPFAICLPSGARLRRMVQLPVATVFNPCEFGGVLEFEHPTFPSIVPKHDAYLRPTLLVVGNSFAVPRRVPVKPVFRTRITKSGKRKRSSPLASARSVDLRRLPPLGFCTAVSQVSYT